MSEIHKSRNRIAGKKYSPEEYPAALDNFIVERVNAGIVEINEIAGQAGKDRSVISKRIKPLAEAGRIKLTETGRLEKTAAQVQQRSYEKMELSEFVSKNPEVQKWVEDMKHRGKGGRPIKDLGPKLAMFKRTCDILKLNPSAFTISQETNEKLLVNLRDQLRTINPKLREGGWRMYTQTVRGFSMSFPGIAWTRNAAPSIASGRKANYGAYSNIFANDIQREGIMKYASDHFEPDLRMAILVGHEALCPRDETLRTLKVGQIRFKQRIGFKVAEFEVFESKTETTWPKQVFDPRIVRALENHIATKAGPDSYLFGNGSPLSREEVLGPSLRACYRSVGIDADSDGNQQMINYWKQKPIHVMRHTTAMMWMRRSGMNPLLVAKQGWKTTDMVTQVYANMGLEEAWNAGRCDFCKPDPSSSGDAHYDSWKCALQGLNQRFGN